MNKRKILTRVAAPAVVGASLVSGFALAALTPHAAFWADGSVAQAQTLNASGTTTDALWPGTCTDITATFDNTNPRPVQITSISQHGDFQGLTPRQANFLRYTAEGNALTGKVIPANATRTFVIKDGVCEATNTDDANTGESFKVGVFAAFEVVPGQNPKAQFQG